MEPRDGGGPIIKFWEESGTLDKLEQAIRIKAPPLCVAYISCLKYLLD